MGLGNRIGGLALTVGLMAGCGEENVDGPVGDAEVAEASVVNPGDFDLGVGRRDAGPVNVELCAEREVLPVLEGLYVKHDCDQVKEGVWRTRKVVAMCFQLSCLEKADGEQDFGNGIRAAVTCSELFNEILAVRMAVSENPAEACVDPRVKLQIFEDPHGFEPGADCPVICEGAEADACDHDNPQYEERCF